MQAGGDDGGAGGAGGGGGGADGAGPSGSMVTAAQLGIPQVLHAICAVDG